MSSHITSTTSRVGVYLRGPTCQSCLASVVSVSSGLFQLGAGLKVWGQLTGSPSETGHSMGGKSKAQTETSMPRKKFGEKKQLISYGSVKCLIFFSITPCVEKSSLNSLCYSKEDLSQIRVPITPQNSVSKAEEEKNTSSVPDKHHSSSNDFPAAGKIWRRRRRRKQGCEYPASQKCTLRSQMAPRSHCLRNTFQPQNRRTVY